MLITVNPVARDVALLIARIGVGIVFFAHGWQKLFTFGLGATAAGFKQFGVPLPTLSAWFSTFVELIGGALLIVGLAVPIAGLLLFLDMLGAYLLVHADKGLFVQEGGGELPIALGCASLLLAVTGSGRFGLDHYIGPRMRRPQY